jgi:cation:H+ antiporter
MPASELTTLLVCRLDLIKVTDSDNPTFNRIPLVLLVLAALAAVLFYVAGRGSTSWWSDLGFIVSIATAISIVISEACDPFSDAAQWVGHRLQLPGSVRGATLDAIASSMPELFTGLFFVTVALSSDAEKAQRILSSSEGYGSTIATCAGSSIYNLILIPALCAIMVSYSRPKRPTISIAPDVLYRDGAWTFFVQAGLLVFLCQRELTWHMGLIAIGAYAAYVFHLYVSTRRFRSDIASGHLVQDDVGESASVLFGRYDVNLTWRSAIITLVVATTVAATACYFLVELTNYSAHRMGVPPFFVAVILTAAVSSVPDTFLSLNSAKRGDDSGAVSNVFGSNIFDVCIGMSIPLLVCCYLNDWQPVQLVGPDEKTLAGVVGLRVFLFVLTSIAMGIMWSRKRVSRKSGWFLCGLYALFTAYAVLGGLGIISV